MKLLENGWAVVFALLLADVLWGVMTFALDYRRERGGKGFSPMPPLLFIGYLWPCFLSRKSLFLGIDGYSLLRLVESLIACALFVAASICIAALFPSWLARRLGSRTSTGKS